MTPSGVITLLTDFGLKDPYVGMMKGAILRGFRQATLVDLTHAISPQDIAAARFWIARSYRWFPPGSLHLVVVDPGVGSARDPLALEVDGHLFVGPDNGVFAGVLEQTGPQRAHRIDPQRLGIAELSATFHGRDLFGPAAAVLAASSDGDLERVGPQRELPLASPRTRSGGTGSAVNGCVVVVDHFGNLITDIAADQLPSDKTWCVLLGRQALPVVRTYAEAAPGQCVALIGSLGTLEVAARDGSAAQLLGAGVGAVVSVEVD
ncbi:MAG TPA: SAM-dependent chlorinase/fluorinase [Polyangiaceae bacterium]|nr:SAM-dependent chlorinase/fluorinase [Polyangiaceae bacterium]